MARTSKIINRYNLFNLILSSSLAKSLTNVAGITTNIHNLIQFSLLNFQLLHHPSFSLRGDPQNNVRNNSSSFNTYQKQTQHHQQVKINIFNIIQNSYFCLAFTSSINNSILQTFDTYSEAKIPIVLKRRTKTRNQDLSCA